MTDAPRFKFLRREKAGWCYFRDEVEGMEVRVRYWFKYRIWTGAGRRRDDGTFFGGIGPGIDVDADIIGALPPEEWAMMVARSIMDS